MAGSAETSLVEEAACIASAVEVAALARGCAPEAVPRREEFCGMVAGWADNETTGFIIIVVLLLGVPTHLPIAFRCASCRSDAADLSVSAEPPRAGTGTERRRPVRDELQPLSDRMGRLVRAIWPPCTRN